MTNEEILEWKRLEESQEYDEWLDGIFYLDYLEDIEDMDYTGESNEI